jgi:hypothetical protein
VYAGPQAWNWEKAAGSCEVDVTCHPEWADLAKGVGGIGTVGRLGYLWCTGTLVTDRDPQTAIPYFLTANHCVGDASEADSLEVYWLYQTPTCNGTPPAPRTVPRTTGGADFLAGATYASGPDFALLRLRGALPDGLAFAGWNTNPEPNAAEVAGIHHPRGDYKRISFGSIDASATDGSGLPGARFYGVRWSLGVTEPGSSGSPLFDAASQRLIGQLYGGNASCSAPGEADYYGRFDQAYPVLEPYIGGTIRITQPNGAEYWPLGTEMTVEWFASSQFRGTVRIDLLRSGQSVATLADGVDIQGSFVWLIPSDLPPALDYAISVASSAKGAIFDTSDAPFAIGPNVGVQSVSPESGTVGGGEAIEIRGKGFVGAGSLTVSLGGAPVKDLQVLDDETLRCLTPVHLPGRATAQVRNEWGGSGTLEEAYAFVGTSPFPRLEFDLNADGAVGADDIQRVVNAVLGGNANGCDVNRDGKVNALDVQAVVLAAIAPLA